MFQGKRMIPSPMPDRQRPSAGAAGDGKRDRQITL